MAPPPRLSDRAARYPPRHHGPLCLPRRDRHRIRDRRLPLHRRGHSRSGLSPGGHVRIQGRSGWRRGRGRHLSESPSTNGTRLGSNASYCAASRAPSCGPQCSRFGCCAGDHWRRPSPRQPACASGPVKRPIRFGSCPTCCMRPGTRSRTAPLSSCWHMDAGPGEEPVCRSHCVLDRAGDSGRRVLANAGANRRVGVWALATLATDAGGWRSINRVGPADDPPAVHAVQ